MADTIYHLFSSIVQSLDLGYPTVGMFFYLTKAFDLIDNEILLKNLQQLGVGGVSHTWISSYLNERKQVDSVPYVDSYGCHCNAQSSTITVGKGVPLGSVLGPLLFLLFIIDLPLSLRIGGVNSLQNDLIHGNWIT